MDRRTLDLDEAQSLRNRLSAGEALPEGERFLRIPAEALPDGGRGRLKGAVVVGPIPAWAAAWQWGALSAAAKAAEGLPEEELGAGVDVRSAAPAGSRKPPAPDEKNGSLPWDPRRKSGLESISTICAGLLCEPAKAGLFEAMGRAYGALDAECALAVHGRPGGGFWSGPAVRSLPGFEGWPESKIRLAWAGGKRRSLDWKGWFRRPTEAGRLVDEAGAARPWVEQALARARADGDWELERFLGRRALAAGMVPAPMDPAKGGWLWRWRLMSPHKEWLAKYCALMSEAEKRPLRCAAGTKGPMFGSAAASRGNESFELSPAEAMLVWTGNAEAAKTLADGGCRMDFEAVSEALRKGGWDLRRFAESEAKVLAAYEQLLIDEELAAPSAEAAAGKAQAPSRSRL